MAYQNAYNWFQALASVGRFNYNVSLLEMSWTLDVRVILKNEKGNMTDIERRILAVIQRGLPVTESPYRDMAREIGIDSSQLLEVLGSWKESGKMRRIGAIVNHFRVGMGSGAMVAWRIGPERIEEVGKRMAAFACVSHAYQRPTAANWPYDLYTMVHASDGEDLQRNLKEMSASAGTDDYQALLTRRELKKVPPTYVK